MSLDPIPDEHHCMVLLKKYHTPNHIILHSKKVWDVGQLLVEGLLRNGYPVDMDLVRASCLLHDIGKYPCIVDGKGAHDVRGEQILMEEGFPSVARVVVQHVILRSEKGAPIREEHIVYYADKRVVHDEVVNLDARFVYLNETYGNFPDAEKWLMRMKNETLRLENQIFQLIDFRPEDVAHLLDLRK